MADAEVIAEVGVSLSKTSLDALSATIAEALDKGLKDFGKKLSQAIGKDLGKVQRDLATSAKKIADQYDRLGRTGSRSLRGLTTGMKATDKETLKLIRSVSALTESNEVLAASVRKSASDFRAQVALMNQATIERTRVTDRAGQAEIETARNVAKVTANEVLVAGQKATVATRFAGQQRVQITRAVIENIARLERGLAATVAGIARTTVGATGRMFDVLTAGFRRVGQIGGNTSISSSSFTSSIKRMNSELNRNVSSALSTREKTIRNSFLRQERFLSESAKRQTATLTRMRQQTSTGVLGAATGRGLGPGLGAVGAGVGLGALLTSGFQRFSEIERLNKQFLALTGNLEEATMLMAQVKEFAKLTPFDLVGVAGLAKGFLAIGTAADQVLPQVRAIADAVALTGGGVEQLDRIQRAIGQVVSTGKLQGDELNQLAENLPGLNIRHLLADQLTGGDVAKLVEMQAAGEISGEAFVDGLITGLQQDKRLVGASEDLAKTLGGIAANTKESFADLGASIIGLFSGQIKFALKGAQTLMQGLSDFIKGEDLSTALDTLRTALGGVAGGLGAVLAARGAVEVFTLLSRSVSLLLTPFGLLATAAGVLGGAFAVMLDKSVPFRRAIERLGDRFGELGERVRSFVGDRLERLSEFIDNTVVPALVNLADWLGTNVLGAAERLINFLDTSLLPTLSRWAGIVVRDLVGAYRVVAAFLSSTVIPRLREFVGFMRSEVFPVVGRVATAVAGRFMDALGAVQRFGQRIRPYIQPAIDGFERLGRSLGRALSGDFSTIGTGAMGALSGIGQSIVQLWDLAFEALRPIAGRFLDWLQGIFSLSNVKKAFSAVLSGFEWVGEQLGTILSSPTFLTAVAGAAGAAGLLALRFIKGFIQGILSNLDELAGLLGDALGALFRAAFTPENILKGVGLALLFATVLKPLIASFRSAGSAAAGAFSGGLTGAMRGASGFGQGLFMGPNATLTSNALGNMKMLGREADVLQNRFRILGKAQVVNTGNLRQARIDMKRLEQSFTPAQIRALEFRDKVGSAFRAIGTTITGAGGVLAGVAQLGKALASPLLQGIGNMVAGAGRGVGNIIGSISMPKDFTEATNAGRQTGEKFGLAWSRGIGNIKTSWSNMMTDLRSVAESQGTSIGRMLGQKIATGAALALGGFVAGRAEGEAGGSGILSALGIGVTGAALGSPLLGAAAAGVSLIATQVGKSGRAAKEARDRIKGFADAIKTDLADAIKDGSVLIIDWRTALEGGSETGFAAQFRAEIEGLIPILNKAGISSQEALEMIGSGPEGINRLIELLRSSPSGGVLAFTGDLDRVREVAEEMAIAIGKADDALRDSLLNKTWDGTAFFENKRAFDAAALVAGNRGLGMDNIFSPRKGLGFDVGGMAGDPRANATAIATLFSDTREYYENIDRLRRQQEIRVRQTQTPGARADADAQFYENLRKANAEWDDFANKPKPRVIVDAAEAAEKLATELVKATTEVDNLLRDRSTESLESKLRDLRLDLVGGAGTLNLDGFLDDLELSAFKDNLVSKLGPILAQAVTEGWEITPANFDPLAQQLLDSLMKGVEDPDGKILAALQATLAELRGEIAKNPLTFAPSTAAGSDPWWGDVLGSNAFPEIAFGPANVDVDASGIKTKLSAAGQNAGAAMNDGMIGSLNMGRARVVAAARATAAAIVASTYDVLGIASPSKVFEQIGGHVGEGLVRGIERSTAAVKSAATSLSEAASSPAAGFGRSLVDGLAGEIGRSKDSVTSAVSGVIDDVMARLNQPTLGQSMFGRVISSMAPSGPGGATSTDFSAAVSKFGSDMAEIKASATAVSKMQVTPQLDISPFHARVREMAAVGREMVNGLTGGIRSSATLATSAADSLIRSVITQTTRTAGVSSPSTVFMEIGRFMGEGLEIGLEDSMTTVGNKMADFIRRAVDDAVEAAKGGTAALREAGTSLFAALTGSSAPLGGGAMISMIGGWTQALQGFMESASSTVSRALSVATKKSEGKEPLTPGELNIFGESATSLNLADVLGVENVSALKSVLDSIVSFGSDLLEMGTPAPEVVDRLKQWRDELLFTSGALGFNVDEVRSLVDSLGLSDTALANFVSTIDGVTAAAEAAALAAKNASNFTAGGMTLDEAKRLRSLQIEALLLSPEDLEVFIRENDLNNDFKMNLLNLKTDVWDNTREENRTLGRILGMWGSTLESFVDSLGGAVTAIDDAVSKIDDPQNPDDDVPEPGSSPNGPVTHLRRPEINVTIHPPYGDPLAIGLAAVNSIALAASLPGQ